MFGIQKVSVSATYLSYLHATYPDWSFLKIVVEERRSWSAVFGQWYVPQQVTDASSTRCRFSPRHAHGATCQPDIPWKLNRRLFLSMAWMKYCGFSPHSLCSKWPQKNGRRSMTHMRTFKRSKKSTFRWSSRSVTERISHLRFLCVFKCLLAGQGWKRSVHIHHMHSFVHLGR